MTAAELVAEVERSGGALVPEGDALRVKAPADLLEALRPALREHKAEILAELRRRAAPRIDAQGDLVIPIDADPSLCWWKNGRLVLDTLANLDADDATISRYRGHVPPGWRVVAGGRLEATVTTPSGAVTLCRTGTGRSKNDGRKARRSDDGGK